ncbi:MAG: hypothetical protein WC796_05625 [Candidatus Pacearchaeota archaeon]|jgi:hypothetical protein
MARHLKVVSKIDGKGNICHQCFEREWLKYHEVPSPPQDANEAITTSPIYVFLSTLITQNEAYLQRQQSPVSGSTTPDRTYSKATFNYPLDDIKW